MPGLTFVAGNGSSNRGPAVDVRGADRAAVLLGDLADDGQPQAGARPAAGIRAAVEAVEDVRQVLGGDASAVVADADP